MKYCRDGSKLCFSKEKFIAKDFTVDKFISECRKHASLEEMREDLSLYHKILCASMIELINKDYADFVNLSSNLVGLEKSLKTLTLPLNSLKNEVEHVKKSEESALNLFNSFISEKYAIYQKKIIIYHIFSVLRGSEIIQELNVPPFNIKMTLPLEVFQRITQELSMLKYHLSKLSALRLLEDKQKEVTRFSDAFREDLEYLFLQSLQNSDVEALKKILKICSALEYERQIELYFQKVIVRPFMKKNLTENAIVKHGLEKLYDDILKFIRQSPLCNEIFNSSTGLKSVADSSLKKYNFLVNSFWPEIMLCFEYISRVHVFAPGDPQLFHQNYSATMSFIEQFELLCGVKSNVKALREQSSYKNFLGKYDLALYFQIRFQEIVYYFEESLLQALSTQNFIIVPSFLSKPLQLGKQQSYLLSSTFSLSCCIRLCWSKHIFLKPLIHNFWKLTLQLISRYCKWMKDYLKEKHDDDSKTSIQAAMLIKDIECLLLEFTDLYSEVICVKVKENELLKASFDEMINILQEISSKCLQLIIKLILKQCIAHLKLMSDIPRLYRKTNREVPSKPSGYVSLLFEPIKEFQSATDSILSLKFKNQCLEGVIHGILQNYFTMVNDVLTSIKKMEDSLKILKKARDKGTTISGNVPKESGVSSDDDKIRRQLSLDIDHLKIQIEKLGLKSEDFPNYKELKTLIVLAEKASISKS